MWEGTCAFWSEFQMCDVYFFGVFVGSLLVVRFRN